MESAYKAKHVIPLAVERAFNTGTYEWHPAGDGLKWSPGLLEIYGCNHQPVGEAGFIDFIHPNDRLRVEAEVSAILSSNATSFSHVFRILRADGTVRTILDRGQIQRDAQGTVIAVRGMNIDLSEVDTFTTAQLSLESMRKSLDGGLAGTWDSVPETGEFSASDTALQLHGVTPGTSITHEAALNAVHPDDRPRVAEALQKSLAEGVPFELDLRSVQPDGGIKWLHTRAQVVRDGPHQRLFGIVQDISERKAAEAALAKSEERFRLAISTSPITVFEQDTDLRYTWIHNTKLGFTATNVIGRTDYDLLDAAVAEAVTAFKHGVLKSGKPDRQMVSVAPHGQPGGIFDLHAHPRFDGSGRVVGLTCVSTDITERHHAEALLRASHDTFAQLVNRSPFGIYVIDADFRLILVSDGARPVFRNVRPLIGRDFAEVLRAIWPEPFATEAIGLFQHTLESGEAYHAPSTVERRADVDAVESYDWKIERIVLPDGRFGAVCHFYDLSEQQRHQDHIELLMQEVNHRSKNLLSLTQAIARQTMAKGEADFIERFSTRVQSLAISQDVLVKYGWKSVPLADLVTAQLGHFADLIGHRIKMAGPEILLNTAASEAISMSLHELATNAAKYGALSNDMGKVHVTWALDPDSTGTRQFVLSWDECDGPVVVKPDHTGFGSIVTTRMIKASLNGDIVADYEPTGFKWRLTCDPQCVLET